MPPITRLLLLFALCLWAVPGFGQVAFRSANHTNFAVTANTTISAPAGTTDNDILLGAITVLTGVAVAAPTGWAEYACSPVVSWGGIYDSHFYWKRAASEGASWTWTHSATTTWGFVSAYLGAITAGDPNSATATCNGGNSNMAVVALSITINAVNSDAVILWSNQSNTGGQTPPSGFTERGDPNNTFGDEDKTYAATGATGDQTTVIVNNDSWSAFFTSIKPPASSRACRINLLGVC